MNGRYTTLAKLRKKNFENGFIYGVEIGVIHGVDGYGHAMVFMWQDRKVHYTSSARWFEKDAEGYDEFQVHGGFDMRQFHMSAVLNII